MTPVEPDPVRTGVGSPTMLHRHHARLGRARRVATAGLSLRAALATIRSAAVTVCVGAAMATSAGAQARSDSLARTDSLRAAARRIEGVTVQAIRAGSDAPIA